LANPNRLFLVSAVAAARWHKGILANVFCGFGGRSVNRSSLTADTRDSDHNDDNGSEGLLHCEMAYRAAMTVLAFLCRAPTCLLM
jgi:hypothetical protein